MTRYVSRHPIFFSVLVVLAALIVINLLGVIFTYLKLPELVSRLIVEIVFWGYVIFLLTYLRWWNEAGFKLPTNWRNLLALLPFLILPMLVVVSNGIKAASTNLVIWFTIYTIIVGFVEEGLMRGVVLHALLPMGVMRAVVLSSLFFGLGHLLNILQGASPSATVIQIIYSILLGIGFAGARLYSGSIWPAIVIHFLIDFVDVAGRGFVLAPPQALTPSGVIVTLVLTGLFAAYGWWLLRRSKINILVA